MLHAEQIVNDHLLPFGFKYGDEVVPQALPSGSVAGPIMKNVSCTFFGVAYESIFVSQAGGVCVCEREGIVGERERGGACF